MRTVLLCSATAALMAISAPPGVAQKRASSPSGEADDSEPAEAEDEPDELEWLIVSMETGYRALDLRKIELDDDGGGLAKLIPANSGGLSPGVGLGVRLWFFSLTLRGDVTFLGDSGGVINDELELWNLDLEAAFHFAQERLQPQLIMGVGYSALGGFSDVVDNVERAADAKGANARLGFGLDYYLTEVLTLGLRASIGGVLLAARTSVRDLATPERVDTLGETEERLREADGSLIGLSYSAGLTFGVHAL